ncbi:hypothetical protein DTO96_102154 [Ephemeroptericola cinctiostellae]|uniref:Uncharacterized protein n=2 Tax=Ephemeroptericola cinctiostellae TaxID=2268024 RepID=A0A345DDG2_9BURK|nr:hypothetical protein DTO96_102154 [Ephemeroptericola cinctiostellae]
MTDTTQTLGDEAIAPNANPQYATIGDSVIPQLNTVARVVAAGGLSLRKTGGGYYSETEPTEVTVTPHIYQLLVDGDLILIQQ